MGPHRGVPQGHKDYRPRAFIYLSDFAESWPKLSTCVRITPVKSFLNQTIHSIVMIKNPNALLYVYPWMRLIRFPMKILGASDSESDYAIGCTWVISLHLCS